MMSDAEIDELAADIQTHGLVEPIVLWADNTQQKETGQLWGPEHCPRYLLDGRSRLMALDRLGYQRLDDVRCRTKQPQSAIRILPAWKREYPSAPIYGAWPFRYLDPWAYVLSVNVRRRHLTLEQRRQIVEDMVRRRPDLTDRALARVALADHKTVAARRAECERSGAIPHIPPAERIEEDGRRSRARKTRYAPLSGEVDWDEDPPRDWQPHPKFKFLSPVKPNAPKRARVVAARLSQLARPNDRRPRRGSGLGGSGERLNRIPDGPGAASGPLMLLMMVAGATNSEESGHFATRKVLAAPFTGWHIADRGPRAASSFRR